ncbi:unnamed protein product [Phytophthora fragariaefolia]|uniref:Unnamed protein product n=1 Tax=Phytophthora fragariaefolia TaxID=1490495 RepID=A0A9W7CVD3_9STRA|nr:unnamed protein product [Phytophthora fragariaefolia]
MIQRQRVKTRAGFNDAQRALAVLDEFCRQDGGNSAEIVVDSDTDVARHAREDRIEGGVSPRAPVAVSVARSHVAQEERSQDGVVREEGGKALMGLLVSINNIAEGDVVAGGLLEVSAAPLSKGNPVSSVAYKRLEDFYEALNNGQVVDFALSNTACFPGLSQVASVGAAILSQTSFADLATQLEASTQASDDEVPPTQRASQSGTQPAGEGQYEKDNDNEAASPVASMPTSVVASCTVDQKDTKSTPKCAKNEELSAKRPLWTFAERPLVHGMTKAQCREKMEKEGRQLALDRAEQYRTGKLKTPAKLEDVARLLDGPYILFHANPIAETLMLPFVNVRGPAQIQLCSVGESVSVVKAIPQLEQVTQALCAVELRPKNLKMVAQLPGYVCVMRDQLEDMCVVHEAYKTFTLVNKTDAWMETVEWDVRDKCYVETLNLGVNKFENEEEDGYKLLDFRENLWLHSTSILMALLTLKDEYPDVGVVDPSYHDFAAMTQKLSVAKGLGAADPQSEQNYSAIERSVRKVMETVLGLEGKLDYKKIDWRKQQDRSSCGIWCIAVLEMLLAGASWNDKIYRLQPYLRMRYLYKVISLLMKPVGGE